MMTRKAQQTRQGVALITALGVLSLLILIVTAFLVTMRIEHLAARNAADKTSSRQYLGVAQTLAMETVNHHFLGRLAAMPDWYVGASGDEPEDDDATDESRTGQLLRRLNPNWTTTIRVGETTNGPCLGSFGYIDPRIKTLVTGVGTNLMSPAAREYAREIPAAWNYIISTNAYDEADETLAGRVSFLVVDLTGTADAHTLTTNQYAAALGMLPEEIERDDFFRDREEHRRYISYGDLGGTETMRDLNPSDALDDEFLDALSVYSYDPNPDQLLLYNGGYGPGDLGTAVLTNKFNVNSITNYFSRKVPDAASDPVDFYRTKRDGDSEFRENYWMALSNAIYTAAPAFPLEDAKKAIFWNLLNYLDADRIPQTDTEHPWLDSYGVEAVPLVNELVMSLDTSAANTNHYNMAVELWYPFAPSNSPPNTKVEVALFSKTHTPEEFDALIFSDATNSVTHSTQWVTVSNETGEVWTELVTNSIPAAVAGVGLQLFAGTEDHSFERAVSPTLSYPNNAFLVATNETAFAFPVAITNETGALETLYTPLGHAEYVTYEPHYPDPEDPSVEPVWLPVTNSIINTATYYARVTVDGHAVDEAPGPMMGATMDPGPWYVTVTNTFALGVADPRWNGRLEYWVNESPSTLGKENAAFEKFVRLRENASIYQGLPILHRDGLLESIGEIGYLSTATRWQSLNLFAPPAAKLLDLWTARSVETNAPAWERGRIHAFSERPAAIRALFADTLFGTNRFAKLEDGEVGRDPLAEGDGSLQEELVRLMLAVRGSVETLPQPTPQPLLDDVELLLPFKDWLPKLWEAGLKDIWEDADDVDDEPGTADLAGHLEELSGYGESGFDLVEDLIRDLPERASFRQNQFLIFLRAQSLSRNGRVTADSSEAIMVVRDAYTGAWTVLRRFMLN